MGEIADADYMELLLACEFCGSIGEHNDDCEAPTQAQAVQEGGKDE